MIDNHEGLSNLDLMGPRQPKTCVDLKTVDRNIPGKAGKPIYPSRLKNKNLILYPETPGSI